MGEPLLGSLICGTMALSMVLWNWMLMRSQQRIGRECAHAAAEQARAKLNAHDNGDGQEQHCRVYHESKDGQAWEQQEQPSLSPSEVKGNRDRVDTLPPTPPGSYALEEGFFPER